MDHHSDHEDLIKEAYELLKVIFEESPQAIYLYLDDQHKICNENFANLLGYDSSKEWGEVKEPFTSAFVDEESQEELVSSFQNAINDLESDSFEVVWTRKDNSKIKTNVILVPFSIKDHILALHFISELEGDDISDLEDEE
ncbi:MAG: PAS domain-containing protein [Nanoarchaeota archaeon]